MKFISAPFGNYIQPSTALAVTGTWTRLPRPGRVKQILKTVRYSFKERGWVNRLGLRNTGISSAVEIHDNDREVLSIGAIEDNDWKRFIEIIPEDYNLEINLSCPNVDEVENIDLRLLNNSRKWCIAKIPPAPLFPTISYHYVDALVDMGFKQIHACNAIKMERGGLSGKQVKDCSLDVIKYIKRVHPHIETIGGGGITTQEDIQDYYNVGADHISLGSVCFTPWKLPALLRN